MPAGEPLTGSRRTQPPDSGGPAGPAGGAGPGLANGQRHGSATTQAVGRARKHKKKEEPQVLTETVDGYRGNDDFDTLMGFIESSDKKDKNGKKSDKSGKKETKGRKNGVRGEEDRSDGFVQDFYSVTTDSNAIEETEFHVESQPAAVPGRMRDAETSTDFIDGVGPIFGERSSPKGRRLTV
ncbi:uncharacterized protein LOC119111382 [Pollicipes pollicipes]|uniref:uncharacterized protein LOC119111382 n=1 Tax=Pollicipes pollicipes TaxID=41117 RepID=UPI001884C4C0|nr:uncharacterized protein LOC119111382 [Pollicipes pollicipes]